MRWTVNQMAETLGVAPPPGSTPWPGWPVSRLIPAPFSQESCSSPYTDRVTMDTITSPALWRRALRPGSWRVTVFQATRRKFAGACLPSMTRSLDSQRLASRAREIWRQARPGRLIGAVAGSVGKTTTKEILAALVGPRFRILKTQGNLNNEYGLPLTLLRLDDGMKQQWWSWACRIAASWLR